MFRGKHIAVDADLLEVIKQRCAQTGWQHRPSRPLLFTCGDSVL
jgi:hypothetical protein